MSGAEPPALVFSGNLLYGTTSLGGGYGNGSVFKISTNSLGFTNIYNFTGGTNGALPYADLILSNNALYGTTYDGGNSPEGIVFRIYADGTGFTNLHNFTPLSVIPNIGTNGDGAYPQAGLLLLSGNTLYGTAQGGGGSGHGTMFAVNIDGTRFMNLHSFAGSDGGDPFDRLIISGNTLYGTAYDGGSSANGTVFSLSFAPQLTITLTGTNVILTWPTNVAGFDYSGFTLQSTTDLGSGAVWDAVSPAAVMVGGLNTVTNGMAETQMFYRLSQ